MSYNPIEKFEYIKREFSEYVISTFKLKNDKYRKDFYDQIHGTELTKGPYLKLDLPFLKGQSLNELMNSLQINASFQRLNSINLDQKLYVHQVASLDKISRGHNVVVTTGTGSGKTESFLYPIYNQLLKDLEKEGKLNGIRAIILYPLNALVNDQLERIRKHLQNLPEITFGIYTGDTKETFSAIDSTFKNRKQYIDYMAQKGIIVPQNEKVVRSEIKSDPPNILITNYSMLEYLLVRPKDNSVINIDTMAQWKYMVLDEAHTYRGTTATEVAYLLRRLCLMADHKPQFILTSATLGSGSGDSQEIANFANKLTSQYFNENDVIFASRFDIDNYGNKYEVDGNDYIEIDKNKDDYRKVQTVIDKYNTGSSLYNFLFNDKLISTIATVLKTTKSFDYLFSILSEYTTIKTKEQLISFINVVNSKQATNNYKERLCTIKYHFFVTTLEGAFVSLLPNQSLALTKRDKIGELVAFEIGTCKYCTQTYLIGKVHNDVLVQSDVDIDDELELIIDPDVGFYLPKVDVSDAIDIDENKLIEYTLCSKCGAIHNITKLGNHGCDCGPEYINHVYRIDVDSEMKNNISQCPICQMNSNRSGIVRTFRLGRDQSTALLTQITYKAISQEDEFVDSDKTQVDLFSAPKLISNSNVNSPQILAFSDSRQQASFFALFLQNNQDKFLRKALVLEAIKGTKVSRINSIATKIDRIIKTKGLFRHDQAKRLTSSQQAYVSLLLELYKEDGVFSLEGLGLVAFSLDVSEIEKNLTQKLLDENLPGVNINDLGQLFNVLFSRFRTAPAIDVELSGLDSNQRRDVFQYRSHDNSFILKKAPSTKEYGIVSFLPVKEFNSNSMTDYLMRCYGLTKENAIEYATNIWNLCCSLNFFQDVDNTKSKKQINLDSYVIKEGNQVNWYMCDKCKTITFNNINNVCVTSGCNGHLHSCDPAVCLSDNYYRKGYLEKDIAPFVAQEHTAQLSREEAKYIAEQFKNGDINLLSTSTTFEMGIDMGDLDTVFLRNIPPTPANYIQRAGRAGRGSKGVGMIITYATNKSHDQMYFNKPEDMIEGIVKVPTFTLANRKILYRHIIAFTIGLFYRENPILSDENQSKLIYFIDNLLDDYLDFIKVNKVRIARNIISILDEETRMIFNFDEWYEDLCSSDGLLNMGVSSIKEELNLFEYLFDDAKIKGKDSDELRKQIEQIKNQEIVNGLAKNNIIPSYGFPINVVDLKIYNSFSLEEDKRYNLSRELSLAISEYAPDSEVIVNKRKFRSRYVRYIPNRALPKRCFYRCSNDDCQHMMVTPDSSITGCPLCGARIEKKEFIEPIYGFMSNEQVKSGPLKPKRTFDTRTYYLGDNKVTERGKRYIIEHTKDDELFICNEYGIYLCEKCGYAKKVTNPNQYIDKQQHNTIKNTPCDVTQLNRIHLGHLVKTDVIKIVLSLVLTESEKYSVLYALINGVSNHMQIDDSNIGGTIICNSGFTNIILFDTTYGGAGNVKKLKEKIEMLAVIDKAIASVSNNCCDINSSCSKCLRTYRNNYYHSLLSRNSALQGLNKIRTIIED